MFPVICFGQVGLHINSPSSIANSYIQTNEFSYAGTQTGWGTPDINIAANAVQGDLVLVDDGTSGTSTHGHPLSAEGCSPLLNSLTGKIAVIYRATCQFGTKFLNAQNAGAIGAILISFDGNAVGMAAGNDGASVTIPSIMVTNTIGQTIINELNNNNTVNATIGFSCVTSTTIDSHVSCGAYTWINGSTYTQSTNSPSITLVSSQGCDSIISLDLTVNNVDVSVSNNNSTITANATGATYQWLDCNNNYSVVPTETNQSFSPCSNGSYAVSITQNGCVDTSVCVTMNSVVSTSIADPNFEQYLISNGYDNFLDGCVLTSNINGIMNLNLIGTQISDLNGIEDFTSLQTLELSDGYLTNINLNNPNLTTLVLLNGISGTNTITSVNTNLPNLNYFTIHGCTNLTSIDLSNNLNLDWINFSDSYISTLDLNGLLNLNSINCSNSNISNLIFSNNQNLNYIDCHGCLLTSLDVSSCQSLTTLNCVNNQLTSLDVSSCQSLTTLNCVNNQLTSLNVSSCQSLTTLNCSDNELTSLDVSSCQSLTILDCFDNLLNCLNTKNGNWNNMDVNAIDNNLTCVEVDNLGIANNQWIFDSFCIPSLDCNYPSNCFSSTTIKSENETNFNLYPNPTQEKITISIDGFNGDIKTNIYDLIGNKLQTSNKTTISLRDYSKGIYILKVTYGDRVEEVKVIKD